MTVRRRRRGVLVGSDAYGVPVYFGTGPHRRQWCYSRQADINRVPGHPKADIVERTPSGSTATSGEAKP